MECEITHCADEFKRMFAKSAGLDYDRILNDREYKEKYRTQMLEYYHAHSNIPFCAVLGERIVQETIKGFNKKKCYVVSDIRGPAEIQQFKAVRRQHTGIKLILVRINISDAARSKRGWTLSAVDRDPTETALDDFDDWDLAFSNNGALDEAHAWVDRNLASLIKAMS
eukprot:TRINITY_DN9075_c0_g2_i2.p1 TRINITY_DN9075_c0_g2~~TRINITY_DN9075_c0_g2_i2.p1  ORF type:complete len:168 (-),score=29.69 TRINITY_DN9075_c0_g2_i2:417-920(-)